MKYKELNKLGKSELDKKLKELELELIKSKVSMAKAGKGKSKEIKKIMARIKSIHNQNKGNTLAQKSEKGNK